VRIWRRREVEGATHGARRRGRRDHLHLRRGTAGPRRYRRRILRRREEGGGGGRRGGYLRREAVRVTRPSSPTTRHGWALTLPVAHLATTRGGGGYPRREVMRATRPSSRTMWFSPVWSIFFLPLLPLARILFLRCLDLAAWGFLMQEPRICWLLVLESVTPCVTVLLIFH
jgi:hypothetical protein